MNRKAEVKAVQELGEQIGYGHLMSLSSALWRKYLKKLGHPESGAFYPTCEPFIDKRLWEKTKPEREMYDKLVKH